MAPAQGWHANSWSIPYEKKHCESLLTRFHSEYHIPIKEVFVGWSCACWVNIVHFNYFHQIKTRSNQSLYWILLLSIFIWPFCFSPGVTYFVFCGHAVARVPHVLSRRRKVLCLERFCREWEQKLGSLEFTRCSVWRQGLLSGGTAALQRTEHLCLSGHVLGGKVDSRPPWLRRRVGPKVASRRSMRVCPQRGTVLCCPPHWRKVGWRCV